MDSERICFKEMFSCHGKTVAFELHEIRCIDPNVVAPMIILTILHISWSLRPIPMPKIHLPKLKEMFNKKIKMEILESSITSYSN